jgi:hypothetical protein
MQLPDNNQHDQDEGLEAPPRLVSALKGLPREPIFIPRTVDESILRAAQRHLAGPRPVRLRWWRWMPLAAAATALVLLVSIPQFAKHKTPGAARNAAFARWDINRDGRVDILDAFALARQLKQGGTPNPQLDLNGDGRVDERDVAAIAACAVKLESGGHS